MRRAQLMAALEAVQDNLNAVFTPEAHAEVFDNDAHAAEHVSLSYHHLALLRYWVGAACDDLARHARNGKET